MSEEKSRKAPVGNQASKGLEVDCRRLCMQRSEIQLRIQQGSLGKKHYQILFEGKFFWLQHGEIGKDVWQGDRVRDKQNIQTGDGVDPPLRQEQWKNGEEKSGLR